jgi:predicted Fe-Mo cluster-binding NifX family protein
LPLSHGFCFTTILNPYLFSFFSLNGTVFAKKETEDFMKIAIPIFGLRVSPRFDCAPSFLLFTVENGEVVDHGEVLLTALDPWQRVARLQELNIQALICGGIDGNSERMLRSHQIRVIPWVAGEVEEALEAFLKGKLEPGVALHLRCCRKRYRGGKVFLRGGKIQR